MADRYDPKLSVRPADRRPSDARRDADGAEEDPLLEFTRVFTGRAALDARPPPVRPVSDGSETEVEVNRDLESELLSDLQASFAAIQAPLAAAASQPAPEPPPPPPMSRATPTAPRNERPRPGGAVQPAAPAVPQFPTFDPPPPSFRPDPPAARTEAPASRVEAPPPRGELRPAKPEPVPVRPEPPTVAVRPPSIEPEELPPPPERPSLFRRRRSEPAEAAKPDAGKVPLRPTIAANAAPAVIFPKPAEAAPSARVEWPQEPPPPPVPTAATRWDWPESEADSAARTASRFAPPRSAVVPAKPATPEPAAPPAPAMLAPDIEDDDELPLEPDFDLADLATVPGYEDEDPLAALPEGGYDDLRPRRFGRGTVLVVLAFLIVIGGGLGIIFFHSPSTTVSGVRPPVIAADTAPTKVVPPVNPSAADADRPNKLIYDRVDDTTDTTGTHLVTPNSNPVADVPNTSGGNPISRVIIPGGPGYDQPTNGQVASAADSTAEDDDTALGPRKVRTVIVRPDGTIVANTAAATDGSGDTSGADVVPTAGPAGAAVPAAPLNPPPLPPATRAPATTSSTVGTGATDSAGNYVDLPKVDRVGPAPGDLPAGPAATRPPVTAAAPVAPTKVPTVRAPTPVPAPVPVPPAPVPHPTVVANTNPSPAAPMDITRAPGTAPAASAPAAAPVAGGSYVQLASLPSEAEAQATFRALQARYGGLLSSYAPNIQRADLGAKGVYFRLRVGPIASADAQHLCGNLKSAGGDCLIAPR